MEEGGEAVIAPPRLDLGLQQQALSDVALAFRRLCCRIRLPHPVSLRLASWDASQHSLLHLYSHHLPPPALPQPLLLFCPCLWKPRLSPWQTRRFLWRALSHASQQSRPRLALLFLPPSPPHTPSLPHPPPIATQTWKSPPQHTLPPPPHPTPPHPTPLKRALRAWEDLRQV